MNGSKVVDIVQAEVKAIYTEKGTQKTSLIPIINKDIKLIVTKEQFSSILSGNLYEYEEGKYICEGNIDKVFKED